MSTIGKDIPSKSTSIKHNPLWMKSLLKRKKQRLYNKAKLSHKGKYQDEYNRYKKKKENPRGNPDGTTLPKCYQKVTHLATNHFGGFVKSQQKENFGATPLQNDKGKLADNSKEKA